MTEVTAVHTYKRHRFPRAILGHAVRLYFGFALSYRAAATFLRKPLKGLAYVPQVAITGELAGYGRP